MAHSTDLTGLQSRFGESRFEILQLIGTGGMGVVYRARDGLMARDVAIKVFDMSRLSKRNLEMFRREMQVLTKFRHANLVQIHSVGRTTDGAPYFVMELVESQTLDQLLKAQGQLNEELTVAIAKQLCAGLHEVHRSNTVHRDLKPSNISVDVSCDPPLVKILDFGIAKIVGTETQAMTKSTTTGQVGSPLFMAPEQFIGKKLNATCDIYALGCIIHNCIAGQPPFSGDSAIELAYKHAEESPPALNSCSEKLRNIVQMCLAKRPQDRFASVTQLAEALSAPSFDSRKVASNTKRRSLTMPAYSVIIASVIALAGICWLAKEVTTSLQEKSFADHINATPQTELRQQLISPVLIESMPGLWVEFEKLRSLKGDDYCYQTYGRDMSARLERVATYFACRSNDWRSARLWWERCAEVRKHTPNSSELERGQAKLGVAYEVFMHESQQKGIPLLEKALQIDYPVNLYTQINGLEVLTKHYLELGKLDKTTAPMFRHYIRILGDCTRLPDHARRQAVCCQALAYIAFADGDTREALAQGTNALSFIDDWRESEDGKSKPKAPLIAEKDQALVLAANARKAADHQQHDVAAASARAVRERLKRLQMSDEERNRMTHDLSIVEKVLAQNR